MKYIFCFKACLSAKGSSELLLYMISKLMTVEQLVEKADAFLLEQADTLMVLCGMDLCVID
jgi:hypothetical protein